MALLQKPSMFKTSFAKTHYDEVCSQMQGI